MKKQHFSILFILLSLVVGYGQTKQDLPEIIKPSPTVASLMRFEEVPVNYYTEQPNIAIPLFSKQLDKNLSLNLALQYSTQGIKVAELSGWVGTGWALEVGGVISRTVRGVPDEYQKGPNGIKTGVLHNPDFWNYANLTTLQKEEFNWNVLGTPFDLYDSQLDLYQFSLLGSSGRFIIVKEAGVLKPKLLSKDQNVKITLDYDNTTYEVNSFTVIDAYGYKYLFDKIEITTSRQVTFRLNQGDVTYTDLNISSYVPDVINRSAWHLTKITTSNDVELATIDYAPVGLNYSAPKTITYNKIKGFIPNSILLNGYNKGILKPRSSKTNYTTIVQSQKPLKITFKDGTSVSFDMTTTNHPETLGAILNNVIIKNSTGQENKRYKLTYSTTDRLWLDKIEEKAGQQTLPYTLFYIDKQGLPAYDSPGSDAWGYNNGISTVNNVCITELQFDVNAIKKGLLWKIDYPTGGSKEFTFEHNTFSYVGNQVIPASEYESNPINSSPTSVINNYQGDNHSINSVASLISFSHAQNIYVSTTLQSGSSADASKFKMRLWNNSGYEALFDINHPSCMSGSVQAGVYYFQLKYVGAPTFDTYSVQGTARLDYVNQNSTVSEYLIGGGVRIKEIAFKEGASVKKKISYDYSDPSNANKSSGAVDSRLGNMTKNYEVTPKKYLFNHQENIAGLFTPRFVTYTVESKGVNAQLTKGGYVGYGHVKVSEQNNGYSTYSYTTAKDYPSPSEVFVYPFKPFPNIDYKRGQLLQQKVYNQANQKLKEITNTYTYLEDVIASSYTIIDLEQCEWKQFYDTYDNYKVKFAMNMPICALNTSCLTPSDCGYLIPIVNWYQDNLISNWAQLTQTISKEYFYDDSNTQSTVEKITDYAYNSSNFQQNNVTTYFYENNLLAEHYTTELFYPVGGYPINTYSASEQQAISKMASLNKINIPIYTKNYKNNVLLNTTQSIYYEFLPNLVELKKVKTAKGSNTLDPRLDYLSYDSHGNIREVSKDKGTIITYLWGYNHSYPVAKIENATYSQIEALPYFGSNFTITNGLSTNQENSLRNLPNALVTTFTYDPLVGLISSKDPRGNKTTFHYDELNRLKWVKDQDGKILSENQYHYKN
jgi:YD repeat-containing protein